MPNLRLLNFAHPLTPDHLAALADLIGQEVTAVLDLPAQFDPEEPLETQVRDLVDSARLSPSEWQTAPVLVNLPGHSTLAAVLLAEVHGRMGHFPTIVRLRPAAGSPVTRYEVAEVIDLQGVRDRARPARLSAAP